MTQQFHFWAYISRKNYNLKDSCTLLFTAALFTTAKTWKQPVCSLAGERIKTGTYITWNINHKKEQNAICSNMYGPRDDNTK